MVTGMHGRSLRLRRPDRCAACGRELAVGEQAIWHQGPRLVTCPGCDLAPSAVAGVPGASARSDYNRRHARREKHAQRKLGVLGTALARLLDEPRHVTAWKRGAEGEERVGARLEQLLDATEVRLLHDRRVPGRKSNIDHIAIGPGGITVIDAKNIGGKVRKDRVGGLFVDRHDVLMIDGRDRTGLVRKVERQIGVVRRVLDKIEESSVDVRGALCFADVHGLPILRSQSFDGILADGPRPVAKLAKRPGPLTPEHVEVLWRRLATALPSA